MIMLPTRDNIAIGLFTWKLGELGGLSPFICFAPLVPALPLSPLSVHLHLSPLICLWLCWCVSPLGIVSIFLKPLVASAILGLDSIHMQSHKKGVLFTPKATLLPSCVRLWRHLDVKSSGFITLDNWDPQAYRVLMEFRETLGHGLGCKLFLFLVFIDNRERKYKKHR